MSNTIPQEVFPLTSSSIPDVSSPYFLHSADHPGSILVSILLNGDNYPTWKRAMKIALNAKNKLSFVNGSLSKPTSSTSEIQLWERCSDMVLSWILNSIDKSIVNSLIYHDCPRDVWLDLEDRFSQSNNPRIFKLKRDVATIIQGSMTIPVYFTTLKGYWDELAMLTPAPKCTCGVLKELTHMQDIERVFQFLMGLHDSYAPIRSQILAMDSLPPVTKVYSILHQEEKQRLLHISSIPTEFAAMVAPRFLAHRSDNKGRGRGRPKYDYCDRDGHWKSNCYKLHGYPKNKPQYREATNGHAGSSMAVNNAISSSTSSEINVPGLTSDQCSRLLDLLSPVNNLVLNTNSTNFAGNLASFSNHNGLLIQVPQII